MNWYKKIKYAEDLSDDLLNRERVQDATSLSNGLRMEPNAWNRGDQSIFQSLKELRRAFHINTIFSRLFNHWVSPHVPGYRGFGDDMYPNKYKSKENTKGGTKKYHNLYLLWKDEIKNAVASIPYIPDVRDMNTEQMVDPAETSRKLLPGGRGGNFEGAIATAKQIEAEAHGEGGKLGPEGERDYDNLLEIYNEEYIGDIYNENQADPFEDTDNSFESPDESPDENPNDWNV